MRRGLSLVRLAPRRTKQQPLGVVVDDLTVDYRHYRHYRYYKNLTDGHLVSSTWITSPVYGAVCDTVHAALVLVPQIVVVEQSGW